MPSRVGDRFGTASLATTRSTRIDSPQFVMAPRGSIVSDAWETTGAEAFRCA
jgi:hypothetical protein